MWSRGSEVPVLRTSAVELLLWSLEPPPSAPHAAPLRPVEALLSVITLSCGTPAVVLPWPPPQASGNLTRFRWDPDAAQVDQIEVGGPFL